MYGDRLELIKYFRNSEVWARVFIHKVPICFVIAQIRNQSVGRSSLGKFSFKLMDNFSTRQSDFTITHSCVFIHSCYQRNKTTIMRIKNLIRTLRMLKIPATNQLVQTFLHSYILSTCCMLCCLYAIEELYQTYTVKFIALMYQL